MGPLWMDFDNDGLKDLFVSNGIPKRLNDIDYVNYISNDEIQRKIRAGEIQEKDMALINKFPEIKLPNRFSIIQGMLLLTTRVVELRTTGLLIPMEPCMPILITMAILISWSTILMNRLYYTAILPMIRKPNTFFPYN
ncbi:hypothetical protein [Paraflavitalea speifideaquila]|uniref:hypothetical protein n=1 Tax=Paraflavitalea speifideaquila TaxID=3076558 RepID=UPI00331300AF